MKNLLKIATLTSSIFLSLFSSELNYSNSLRIEAKAGPYYDFGVCGKEYEITEPDFYQMIIEGAQDYVKKMDREEIKKQLEKEVAKKAKFITNKAFCSKNYQGEWYNDYYTYKMNVYNPLGRLIFKKGEKRLVPPIPERRNICFVDGRNKIELFNQISFFNKKNNHNCLFIVSNYDVRKLWEKYPGEDFYPGNDYIMKRFNVKCLPAEINMYQSQNRENYFSIEQFKN